MMCVSKISKCLHIIYVDVGCRLVLYAVIKTKLNYNLSKFILYANTIIMYSWKKVLYAPCKDVLY